MSKLDAAPFIASAAFGVAMAFTVLNFTDTQEPTMTQVSTQPQPAPQPEVWPALLIDVSATFADPENPDVTYMVEAGLNAEGEQIVQWVTLDDGELTYVTEDEVPPEVRALGWTIITSVRTPRTRGGAPA